MKRPVKALITGACIFVFAGIILSIKGYASSNQKMYDVTEEGGIFYTGNNNSSVGVFITPVAGYEEFFLSLPADISYDFSKYLEGLYDKYLTVKDDYNNSWIEYLKEYYESGSSSDFKDEIRELLIVNDAFKTEGEK